MQFIKTYNKETYEQQQLEWLKKLFAKIKSINPVANNLMLDVGAYQGLIIDLAHNQFKSVVGFEPHPASYNKLKEKYQNKDNVQVLQLVVDQTNLSEVNFTISQSHPESSYLHASPIPLDDYRHTGDHQVIKLPSISIDAFMKERTDQVVFIKIDCEGHDFFVLQGCKNTLLTHRPLVLFEFGGKTNGENYGYSAREWYQFFKDNSYTLISPIGAHDERFICSHYAQHNHDLVDILAIPSEQYDQYVMPIDLAI